MELVTVYSSEIFAILFIAMVMAISPGADFVVVTRSSLTQSRNAGLFATLGIGIALWIHISYSIAGIAVLINSSPVVFTTVKYLGSAYLLWLGWQSLRSSDPLDISGNKQTHGLFHFLKMGFFCNALNPKATLFFISIFTNIVAPDTPLTIQLLYGFIISMMHVVWFSLVSIFITRPGLLRLLTHHKSKIDKFFGILLIVFGLNMGLTDLNINQ